MLNGFASNCLRSGTEGKRREVSGTRRCIEHRHATDRTYIYGFFQASIALCRAALEAGLNELLKRSMGTTPRMDLIGKINQASRFKLLDSMSASEAHEVRKAARTVLHEKPASQSLAFDTVARARGVLIKMYEN